MKKAICIILCAAMLLALAACGGSDSHKKDLLLQLSFDEGKGLTVKDSAGKVPDTDLNYEFSHAAYMDNQDPQWRSQGISGGCLLLDGSSTYVSFNRNDITVSGKAFTAQAWIAPRMFEWDDPNAVNNGTDAPTGILSQSNKSSNQGFLLGYERFGRLTFQVGTGSDWISVWSNGDNLKKYAWNLVTATFDSDAGIIACKGMKKLLDSPANLSSSDGAAFAKNAAVVVTGTWAYTGIKEILGDNMGAADLPSFEVDGQTYHLGSFNGFKLMGVKPQDDANKGAALHKLAQYLTSEQGQLERFNAVAWGPSNTAALAKEEVQANPAIAAVVAQGQYATPQGQIHGSWWNIAKVIGDDVTAANDEAGYKEALDSYKAKIDALFGLSGYIFVGAWCDWDNASADFKMEDNNGVLTITLDVPESDYMGGRIVTAGTWDTDLGFAQVTEGADLLNAEAAGGDNNIVFNEAGNYTVTCDTAAKTISIVKN